MRLKELRKKAGLNQKQVAEMLGMSQNNYSCIEQGKVKPREVYLEILAEKYGVSVDCLVDKKSCKNIYETKFARNQAVWYIRYVTSAYACPHCGEECYEEKVDGVRKGVVAYITIKDGDLDNAKEELEISYTITAERRNERINLYTTRSEEYVFATEEEALKRLKELAQ